MKLLRLRKVNITLLSFVVLCSQTAVYTVYCDVADKDAMNRGSHS